MVRVRVGVIRDRIMVTVMFRVRVRVKVRVSVKVRVRVRVRAMVRVRVRVRMMVRVKVKGANKGRPVSKRVASLWGGERVLRQGPNRARTQGKIQKRRVGG